MADIGQASWSALGTTAHVLVTDSGALDAATTLVHDWLNEVDATYSRFRADSELSRLNAAGGRPTAVSPLLFDAVETAIRVARMTDGAVDPTIGHRLRLLGYDRDFAALPPNAPAPRLLIEHVPGWQTIELDAARHTVRMPSGVSLDLGSSGKALAADRAASAVHLATGSGVLVSLGGDIAIAGDAPAGGWRVRCAEDHRESPTLDSGEVIALRADALATSSTSVRRWTAGGAVRHHIVDPATGLPALGPWRSASVVAATCVGANAASTAAIVLGDRAIDWLEQLGLPARLTDHDGRTTRVGGWPQPVAEAAITAA